VATFAIDAMGGLTAVSTPAATGKCPESIVVDPSGAFAFTADTADNTVTVLSIDPMTGLASDAGAPVALPGSIVCPRAVATIR
jgi:6-phosphogluconolactonase (cycloisomerase 2 family)